MKEAKQQSTHIKRRQPRRIKRTSTAAANGPTDHGLYAAAASCVPEAKDGQKSATVWSAIWRILTIVLLFGLCMIPQALYYAHVNDDINYPGLLAYAGITWGTWWGTIILVAVFLLVGLAPVIVAFAAVTAPKRHRILLATCILCAAMVLAIVPGNSIGNSLWWWECYKYGPCHTFVTHLGIVSVLPIVILGILLVAATVILWFKLGRVAECYGFSPENPWSYLIVSIMPLSTIVACMCFDTVSGTMLMGLWALYAAGIVIPNEFGAAAYVIKTRRLPYWLWHFALIIVFWIYLLVGGFVAIAYGL